MNKLILLLALFITLSSCSQNNKDKQKSAGPSNEQKEMQDMEKYGSKQNQEQQDIPASQRVVLDDKGVGPVENVTLMGTVDQDVADQGKKLFDQNCALCHKVDQKYIGPKLQGILDRRTPEWVMNMMLNPEVMVKENPLAKDLFQEYNNSPMSNQNLSDEEASAILEYLRTL